MSRHVAFADCQVAPEGGRERSDGHYRRIDSGKPLPSPNRRAAFTRPRQVIRYQICGPGAFSRYGWDDQIPNRLYAYNNRIWGERKIGSAAMPVIALPARLAPDDFFTMAR